MVFGVGCQGERLFPFLCIAQTFVLAGAVCSYFQGPAAETAPGRDIAGDTSQPTGETLRPVWGPMDQCYPGAAQRRRVRSGKKEAAEAGAPKAVGGPSDAAPREEPGVRPQDAGEARPPAEDAAGPTPAGKDEAEKEAAAGTPAVRSGSLEPQLEEPQGTRDGGPGGEGEGWVPQMTPDNHPPVRVGIARAPACPALSGTEAALSPPHHADPVSWAPGPLLLPGETEQPQRSLLRPSEASEVGREEDGPQGATQPPRKLWLGWFPASDSPETRNRDDKLQ